jgi:hypothetical protein
MRRQDHLDEAIERAVRARQLSAEAQAQSAWLKAYSAQLIAAAGQAHTAVAHIRERVRRHPGHPR